MSVTVESYGSWTSPITSDRIVESTIGLGDVVFDEDDICWLEVRPQEGGRSVLVRRKPDGQTSDLATPPWNLRTRVHEYGGGAFLAVDGVVYGSNFDDQRLYRYEAGQEPVAITEAGSFRYADAQPDRARNRIICVREDHSDPQREAVNTLVAIPLAGDAPIQVLTEGHDFYSSPALSPDGAKLAWLSWDHPNMPWDGTILWVATIGKDGSLGPATAIAGGVSESIFQPQWAPEGALYFMSDRSGWWNLHRFKGEVEHLLPMEAEFAMPQWIFGMSTYAIVSESQLVCTYFDGNSWNLASYNTETSELTTIQTEYSVYRQVRAQGTQVAFVGASPTRLPEVVLLDLTTHETSVLQRTTSVNFDPDYLSVPEAISFPTNGGEEAFAYLYLPKNRDFRGSEEDRPPLLVMSHGGPTGATSAELNLSKQFWTSRGFAVLDVNYGGSTGYGRSYRERLRGRWGIVDVNDCVAGALFLVTNDKVDRNRLAIRGGSAGGYTTLAALAFRKIFHAGASYFGVGDLEALAKDTHKFESRYLDGLIGPYPARRDLYLQRAPIQAVDRLSCPIIFFQGLEDRVVLPNQAEMMVDALREKGVPVAYFPFEDEQHGFRKAENIKRSLDSELYFYARVLGFPSVPTDGTVEIENLP